MQSCKAAEQDMKRHKDQPSDLDIPSKEESLVKPIQQNADNPNTIVHYANTQPEGPYTLDTDSSDSKGTCILLQ